ncbi:MAG: hypothetical protein ACRD2O_05665, partial [Terriglobia bacterium]
MPTFTVELNTPAHEMAREEIGKQIAFLSKDIRNVRFSGEGKGIDFDAPAESGPALIPEVRTLATRIERALRNLQRKIVYSTPEVQNPQFAGPVARAGIHFLGTGQVALEGLALRLFRYFDRVFEQFGAPWNATPLLTPTLIPGRVLARCDYFRSFPQYVTFACHLKEEVRVIDGFRARHQTAGEVDDSALSDMERPEACLSPAVCYHVYHLTEN